MRDQANSTATASAAPAGAGQMVIDFCAGRLSDNSIEESLGLGRDQVRDEHALARERQERRWWPWITVANGFICAVIGFEMGQRLPLATDGRILDESVVARLFLELLEEASLIQIRDHSSIDRAEISLGVEGKAAVLALYQT